MIIDENFKMQLIQAQFVNQINDEVKRIINWLLDELGLEHWKNQLYIFTVEEADVIFMAYFQRQQITFNKSRKMAEVFAEIGNHNIIDLFNALYIAVEKGLGMDYVRIGAPPSNAPALVRRLTNGAPSFKFTMKERAYMVSASQVVYSISSDMLYHLYKVITDDMENANIFFGKSSLAYRQQNLTLPSFDLGNEWNTAVNDVSLVTIDSLTGLMQCEQINPARFSNYIPTRHYIGDGSGVLPINWVLNDRNLHNRVGEIVSRRNTTTCNLDLIFKMPKDLVIRDDNGKTENYSKLWFMDLPISHYSSFNMPINDRFVSHVPDYQYAVENWNVEPKPKIIPKVMANGSYPIACVYIYFPGIADDCAGYAEITMKWITTHLKFISHKTNQYFESFHVYAAVWTGIPGRYACKLLLAHASIKGCADDDPPQTKLISLFNDII